MAYCLVVRFTVKEGELDGVLAAIGPLVEASRREPGCLMYQAHRDPENRTRSSSTSSTRTRPRTWPTPIQSTSSSTRRRVFPRRENADRATYVTFEP
jgi:hypothetical protein